MLNLIFLIFNTSGILAARRKCPGQLINITVIIKASFVLFKVIVNNKNVKNFYNKIIKIHKASNY